ncbi:class D beta-lactamase [Methylibium sp.]|uniref:class D beta-lactamase n=1 Tax=Methylibium sp. TaxID=2067992 RepID=UPI0017C4EBFB|nr:class D beta-lactamase [Methylibium sp.]MBA3590694.1 class D beta-lactamase [Methylibium sp.]
MTAPEQLPACAPPARPQSVTAPGVASATRRALLGGAFAAVLPGCAPFAGANEATALDRFFSEERTAGCFALLDAATGESRLVNGRRARQRFAPASTFKIPNSLIALEAGAVRDEREVVPYGGKPQLFPQWERDLNLREAFAASSVPVCQELARRIGLARMRAAVAGFGYGNAEVGGVVDRFWLDGPLAISAIEQAAFLVRLAQGSLPVSARSLAIVRDISTVETRAGAVLHAKSGWLFDAKPQVGWWVGWVEQAGGLHGFALNIDMQSIADAPRRERIGRRLLEHFGVFAAAG